jgi:hypothetical protein
MPGFVPFVRFVAKKEALRLLRALRFKTISLFV